MMSSACGKPALRGEFIGPDEAKGINPDPQSVLHLRSAARRSGLHLARGSALQPATRLKHRALTLTAR